MKKKFDYAAANYLLGLLEKQKIEWEGGHKPWYGIPGIVFIWHGAWIDPEIEYKGHRCSCYTVEDTMWERFREEHNSDDPDLFAAYMKENADDVYELCEIALFPEKYQGAA